MTVHMRDAVINFEMTAENRRRIAIELQDKALRFLSEDIMDFDGFIENLDVNLEVDDVADSWSLKEESSTTLLFLARSVDADCEESETILIVQEIAEPPRYWALQKVVAHSARNPEPDQAILALMKEYVDSLQSPGSS